MAIFLITVTVLGLLGGAFIFILVFAECRHFGIWF
jgi:hypothetical protein